MKSILLTSFVLFFSLTSLAQLDTVYMNGEKVLAKVKEITPEAVKFSYPDEDLINTVYRDRVQKIAFNNGRVQTFTSATSFKTVNSVEDHPNVTVTGVEAEVAGLTRVGEVGAKATGTTTLSSIERVKNRAYRKMKTEAAMMGGNVVFLLDQWTTGNVIGTDYQAGSSTETNLTGTVYTDQPIDYHDFLKVLGENRKFLTKDRYKLRSGSSNVSKNVFVKHFSIDSISHENGIITLHGKLEGARKNTSFQLASFDDEGFNAFYSTGTTAFNIRVPF